MRRIAVEFPIMAVTAAVMASLVLVAGTALEASTEPTAPSHALRPALCTVSYCEPAELIILPGKPVGPPAGNTASCLETTMDAASAPGVVGTATLCHDGRDLRTALRVGGLARGEMYIAWLSYLDRRDACSGTPCEAAGPPHERVVGLMHRIGGGIAPASGTFEIDASLRDVQLVRGAQVSLLLLPSDGQAGPEARAAFTIP